MKLKVPFSLRQWHGPLTRDLVRQPGGFGLGQVPARLKPDATTRAVCGFCSTGCGLKIHLHQGRAVNLTADTDYPVNIGMACPKGWEALTPLAAEDRGVAPLFRNQTGQFEPLNWADALQLFCRRFKEIQTRHGKESLAFISTGQIVSEEMALLGILAKFGMGMLHGDGNTRQCMATAVKAYKESFGFDAPPFTYQDFEESTVLVFIGANPCIAHPIMWQRVMRNPHHPEIIVVDPRKTETAMSATTHYAIRPKSDLVLLYGLANILIQEGWLDDSYIRQHTCNFPQFREFVADFTPAQVAGESGLTINELQRFATSIGKGKRVSFWWTMGVNQGHEATRTAQAIINLALMTGNLGKPGTGANSITGQCNAMGSRLFSNTTNLLGGYEFTNPGHRQKIASILDIDESLIPQKNSWAYDEIIRGIADGKIKGLWIIATNTAHSWIQQNELKKLLGQLDFLVVQDMYHSTETARLANLILPAAGWGEKTGTFINSERRIGLVKKVAQAPGQALSDFNIFRLVAEYWGCGKLVERLDSPERVFQLLKEIGRGQPWDISGISGYDMLEQCAGIQWPWVKENQRPDTQRRLFADGCFYHPDKRARFIFEKSSPLPETTSPEYPFFLLTGRGSSAQWHTQTRTGKSAVLKKLYSEDAYVEVNPVDARRLGIRDEMKVCVKSRRGEMVVRARLTSNICQGQIFIPMHYAATNQLTLSVVDPYSRQPSYKSCAVRLEKLR